jgi:hypothetical protein
MTNAKRVIRPIFAVGDACVRLTLYNFACATPLLQCTFFSQYMSCSEGELCAFSSRTRARCPAYKSASALSLNPSIRSKLDITAHEPLSKFANESRHFDHTLLSKTWSSAPPCTLSDINGVLHLSGAHCHHRAGPAMTPFPPFLTVWFVCLWHHAS